MQLHVFSEIQSHNYEQACAKYASIICASQHAKNSINYQHTTYFNSILYHGSKNGYYFYCLQLVICIFAFFCILHHRNINWYYSYCFQLIICIYSTKDRDTLIEQSLTLIEQSGNAKNNTVIKQPAFKHRLIL